MAETITIRTTGPGDIGAVDALLARSYPRLLAADYPPSVLVTAVPIISRARPELVSSGTYYVAETDDGRVLGAGGWTLQRGRPRAAAGNDQVRAIIRHVVTDPDHTRRGIGAALFDTIFEVAGEEGVTAFECLSTFTAVPFYTAMGFAEVGYVEITLAPGITFPAVRMMRVLPGGQAR